jgi:AAA family ATP:ADP antiporter
MAPPSTMTTPPEPPSAPRPGSLDRLLRLFSDVRPGEGVTAVLLLVSLFLLLAGYYILKTVREPLILTLGGAEMKSYAAAGQALALMVFVPLYGWIASRVDRLKLIVILLLFFIANIELFYLGGQIGVPYLGFVFYVWVGIFSLASIAQFWAYANDLYSKPAGDRLFPIIAIGATAGSPVGTWVCKKLFEAGFHAYSILHFTVVLLVVHLVLYVVVNRRESARGGQSRTTAQTALGGPDGFSLVLASPYLRLVVLLLVLLNTVNTTGEYIIGRLLVSTANAAAAADPHFSKEAFIGSFYGSYFLWVNIAAVTIQAFLVSRIVKYLGIAGVILALPLVALGAYSVMALGASFAVVRWAKSAENATDYSVMNTGKQMLWLPTSREEKYKAKQAADTFFVRTGDLFSAGIVFVGTTWLALGVPGFAFSNVILTVAWLAVAILLLREHRRVMARAAKAEAA